MDDKKVTQSQVSKQRKPLTKSDKISLLIFFLAPIGLIVMWLKSGWKVSSKLIVTVLGILWIMFGWWLLFSPTKATVASPKIEVSDSAKVDGKFIVKSTVTSVTIKTGETEYSEKTKLTVNGKKVEPWGIDKSSFFYKFEDKRKTEYKVVAENANGKDEAIILIRAPEQETQPEKAEESKPDPESQPTANQDETDAIFEAEITCQEYAESHFGVKDVNIHYDQSSIKRKNPDGSILIKVNIADSQGLLRSEKSLGVMECTTTPDGMKTTGFLSY